MGRVSRTVGIHLLLALTCLAFPLITAPTYAQLIGNNFRTDPGWTGMNNVVANGSASKARDDDNHYTYFPGTASAFGTPGEVGGYFGRNTFDAYYADTTLGGNLGGGTPLMQPLQASGRMMINNDHNPNAAMYLGFFDANNPTINGNRLNIMIAEIAGGASGFRPRLELRQSGGFDANGKLETNLLEGHYTWTMDYDPTANSGNGRVTAVFTGPETVTLTLDVPAGANSSPLTLNAFGLQNYNAGSQTPLLNKHYVFLDDLSYSTAEAIDPVAAWDRPSHGSWNTAPSWRGTSRTDGAGFIPDGADRTAVFGSGITEDAVVVVDSDVSVQRIEFSNATHRFAIAGVGQVVLDDVADTMASIEVISGHHEFQAPVRLEDNATVTVAPGGVLDFHNRLDLNGNTLTLEGENVNFLNAVIEGGGIVNSTAVLGGSALIDGDLHSSGVFATDLDTSRFEVSGVAQLAGTVDVVAVGNLSPGDTHTILTAGTIVDHGLVLSPEDDVIFELLVGPSQLIVQVAIPEPGTRILCATMTFSLMSLRRRGIVHV